MDIHSNQSRILLLAIIALPAISRDGRGAYEELKAPSVARSDGYSASEYKKIQAVLERKDCKFLGGNALNAFTSLRYGGETIPLNLFIEALSRCPNSTVHVGFYRPAAGAPACDWMVTHEPKPNSMEFVVRINLNSKNIKLESLYLPPVKAPNDTRPKPH